MQLRMREWRVTLAKLGLRPRDDYFTDVAKRKRRRLAFELLEKRELLTTVTVAVSQNAVEGTQAGHFTFTRDATTSSLTVNFSVNVANTTATNGVDLPYLPGTGPGQYMGSVTFPAGQATADIAVDPTGSYDDAIVEGTEQIQIYLTGGGGCCCGGEATPWALPPRRP